MTMSRTDKLRAELGPPHPAAQHKVKNYLERHVQAFIRHAPFAVLATSNGHGDCDASPKGGLPGFIRILDDRCLLIPDVGGNRLFQSYENVETNPKAALVIMIPGMDVTVRVNGRVTVVERGALDAMNLAPEVYRPDENSALVQGLMLDVDEAYFHCPRAFVFSDLWNTATIEGNARRALKDLLPAPETTAGEKEHSPG